MTGRNVLYFGDSIMVQKPRAGYVHLLGSWIFSQDEGSSRHHFLNVGGNTSRHVLDRFGSETEARQNGGIRGFVISTGIVDSSFLADDEKSRVSIDAYRANVFEILSGARALADNVIVPGLTRVDESRDQPLSGSGNLYDNERIAEYDAALKRTAEMLDARYIQIHDALQPHDYDDGLHPSDEGHRKIFVRLSESGLGLTGEGA